MSAFGTYGFPAGNLAYEPPRSGFTYSFLAVAATQTVRIPLGVSWGRASVIGAGGTGGTQAGANASALIGGGGGGGYAQATIFVIPGQIYTLTGGAAPAGTSSFGSLVSATGGATATTSTGGAGGVGAGGDINYTGGNGGNGATPAGLRPEVAKVLKQDTWLEVLAVVAEQALMAEDLLD